MKVPRLVVPLAGVIAVANAFAQPVQWRCDADIEVQCDGKACTATDNAKPPIEAQFDRFGNVSICLYSGCYSGKGTAVISPPFISVMTSTAKWSGVPEHTAAVHIALDTTDGIATFKAAGFAQPLRCKQAIRASDS